MSAHKRTSFSPRYFIYSVSIYYVLFYLNSLIVLLRPWQKLKDICKLVDDMIKYSAVDYATGMKELESITRSVNAHCNHLQQAAEEAKRESIATDVRCRELESRVR